MLLIPAGPFLVNVRSRQIIGRGRRPPALRSDDQAPFVRLLAGSYEGITTEVIAGREGLSERAVRMQLSLAFLAPDIVEAAITGHLPKSFGITRLAELPMDWAEQRRTLGLAGQAT